MSKKYSDKKANLESTRLSKPIPITLLSGFLGSGKTTLLEHILTAHHGYRIAVIINDVSQLNIDAALIQDHKVTKKEEKLIQLQNGCICCTLRGDLLEELVQLATKGEFEYIIIESTGISEPMQVAETFTSEFSQMLLESQGSIPEDEERVLKEIIELGGLSNLTKLDTCVTVVDAKNFISNFKTTDFLADRYGENGQGETERTITDLMVDQIEFSDVIILNKISTIKEKKQKKIENILKSLNPVAKIIKTDYSKVDISEVINTKKFNFEVASTSAGWLQSLNEMTMREGFGLNQKAALTPKPETEEYGINNFIYKSRRPFHPERLYKELIDKFFIIEQSGLGDRQNDDVTLCILEDESEEEENDEEGYDSDGSEDELSERELIANKQNSPFGPLLRSKGFFWLASRHIIRGEWSSAGSMLTLKGGIPWFDVTGPEFYPPEAADLIKNDMEGKHGDRRNELVFIGLNIDKNALTTVLDSCLLTDEEYTAFEDVVANNKNLFYIEKSLQTVFDDGFEDWIRFESDDDVEATAELDDDGSEEKKAKHLKATNKEVGDFSIEKHGSHTHVRIETVST